MSNNSVATNSAEIPANKVLIGRKTKQNTLSDNWVIGNFIYVGRAHSISSDKNIYYALSESNPKSLSGWILCNSWQKCLGDNC